MSRPPAGPQHPAAHHGLVEGVRGGSRRALAKAITLVESTRADDLSSANALLDALRPFTGGALRIGLSGAPGVGKSTLVEALGLHVVAEGHRPAVLAVDPSSSVSGGSVLGDKTRMERLGRADAAFIRPSPSAGAPGGVAARTPEAIAVCEAAGFDVVIVETVGVGQAEIEVAGMTDVFVLLELPFAGDGLQAIKRGSTELADVVVYAKADLDEVAAEAACVRMSDALGLLRPPSPAWRPRALTVSARHGARHRGAVGGAGSTRETLWSPPGPSPPAGAFRACPACGASSTPSCGAASRATVLCRAGSPRFRRRSQAER